jgi:hypothetical protein
MSEQLLVNRIEVIDHTLPEDGSLVIDPTTGRGRVYVKWVKAPFRVECDIQDDGRTLKIFLSEQQERDKP